MSSVSHLPVRIYYEDTDAGGIVYHASYLRFMERGRTEMLRDCGYGQAEMMEQGAQFVLSGLSLKYRRPAFLDDEVVVESSIVTVKRTWLAFEQVVKRGEDILCEGSFRVACIDTQAQKPMPIPQVIRQQLASIES